MCVWFSVFVCHNNNNNTAAATATFGPRERDPLSEWPSILIGRLVTCLAGQARPDPGNIIILFDLYSPYALWQHLIGLYSFWFDVLVCSGTKQTSARVTIPSQDVVFSNANILNYMPNNSNNNIDYQHTNPWIFDSLVSMFQAAQLEFLSGRRRRQAELIFVGSIRFAGLSCPLLAVMETKLFVFPSNYWFYNHKHTHTQNRQRNIKTNKITIGKGTHRN